MIQALFYLLFLATGYYLGLQRHEKDIVRARKGLGKARAIITGKVKGQPASGIIYRPSAARLRELNKTKRELEADEATTELLDEIPELQQAKKLRKRGEQ